MTTHPTDNQLIEARAYFDLMLSNAKTGCKHSEAVLWKSYLALHPSQDTQPDNPPAFPFAIDTQHYGMTLRDYFAGQALASINVEPEGLEGELAEYSYRVADAMLTERSKTDDR